MQIDDKKFNKVKNKANKYYKSIGKVMCPYFKDYVHFNVNGFDHLLFKTWNRGRSKKEQYTRLRLLPLVVKIVSRSHTLQEYDERRMFVRQKINSRWEKRVKLVRYYAFVAIIQEVRLKIIIKEINE